LEGSDYKFQTYHERKCDEWLEIIRTCKSSGMSVKDWCVENHVMEKNYWRWHKILKDECLLKLNNSALLPDSTHSENSPAFYEVPIPKAKNKSGGKIATINIFNTSIDVFSEDAAYIVSIIKGLSC